MRIDTVEMVVQNYPEGFEGWRLVRVEYLSYAEYCLKECSLWVPPEANLNELEKLFSKWQEGG